MAIPRKRYMSVWLPHWAVNCRFQGQPKEDFPYVQVKKAQNKTIVVALNALARQEAVQPNMPLATAQAITSGLVVEDYQPDILQTQLEKLADWTYQFTPFVACDGTDGLILDVTGCPHLFGGEQAMLLHISDKLTRIGFQHHLAMADTAASAWGFARYGKNHISIQTAPLKDCIQPLPIEAMRLPDTLIRELHRMGLRHVTDLMALPRASLSRRYGLEPVLRLDQMLGDMAEPITPRLFKSPHTVKLSFPDAIGLAEDIAMGLDRLIDRLCQRLENEASGAKQLHLICERVNRSQQVLTIGLHEASHNTNHIRRLFQEKLPTIEPGFGIDAMRLIAPVTEKIRNRQNIIHMTGERQKQQKRQQQREELNILVDRLRNRLGKNAIGHIHPRETHLPDRIQVWQEQLETAWSDAQSHKPLRTQPRPSLIHNRPIPLHHGKWLDRFIYKGRQETIIQMQGPERISPNWWQRNPNWQGGQRDYYIAKTKSGRRYWLYCETQQSDHPWYLHGTFN